MKLTFVGAGYVGLVTGACMAELGHTVVCVDVDRKKIHALKKGIIPIYEPGLKELVDRNVKKKRLSFTLSMKEAMKGAEVVFSGVGTPPDPKTGEADLQYVFEVAKAFAEHVNGASVLVNKSTVPVGTAEKVTAIVKKHLKDKDHEFDVVSNPEFLREGSAVKDFLEPDRVVVGVPSERARKIMEKVYAPLIKQNRTVFFTDVKSAEIIKYASNSFLATKITFINEIANFCAKAGGNVKEVAAGMGFDNRISKHFLRPGIGYGGSCFPKDVKALIASGKEYASPFEILTTVERVNAKQKMLAVKLLQKHIRSMKGKTIAVWGLAFKPDTDDMREAASLVVIRELLGKGVTVRAYDPVAMPNAKAILGKDVTYAKDALDAIKGADALILVTEWKEFAEITPAAIAESMPGRIVIDGRNALDRKSFEDVGFAYEGVGV